MSKVSDEQLRSIQQHITVLKGEFNFLNNEEAKGYK